MKTIITTLAIIASAFLLFGETVWTHSEKGSTKIRPASVELNGRFVYEPTDEEIADAGWTSATYEFVDVTNTVTIPSSIYDVGTNYQGTLDRLFYPGAATDTNLSREAITITLSLRSDVDANDGLRLQAWAEILESFADKAGLPEKLWYFPYGQLTAEIITKQRIEVED